MSEQVHSPHGTGVATVLWSVYKPGRKCSHSMSKQYVDCVMVTLLKRLGRVRTDSVPTCRQYGECAMLALSNRCMCVSGQAHRLQVNQMRYSEEYQPNAVFLL